MGRQRVLSWLGVLIGVAVLVGLGCAVLWAQIVHLPSYTIGPGHVAEMSEHGYTEVFAADAAYVLIGLAAGFILGGVAWSWFKSIGWLVGPLAMVTGLLAGLVCWTTGQLMSPGPFAERLAHAEPGASVTIAFQLHTPVALLAWGLAATVPGLFLAALGPEVVSIAPSGLRGRTGDARDEPAAAADAGVAS